MVYRQRRLFIFSLPLLLVELVVISGPVVADGPKDNDPTSVRSVPPTGIAVSDTQDQLLRSRAKGIDERLASMDLAEIELGIVAVIPRAVRMTLDTQMVYSERDLKSAHQLLDLAEQRLRELNNKQSTWRVLGLADKTADQPQLVVGGFHSRIDGSVQPYGLVVPGNVLDGKQDATEPLRLDVWLHGRGERSSEVGFLKQRLSRVGEYAPENTIVLHPYGRYSNAFKFAGEIDVLEAIEHVKKLFPIDDSRIAIRGFSMGGAGCWQLAVHYPDLWAAANPGAGFSETRKFLSVFQAEEFVPTKYQAPLLHWYDCPDWTNNLRNVPTVAYSGEIDKQKQAADVMAASFRSNGMKLSHVIGPETAHKIHADSKIEIQSQLDEHLTRGKPKVPSEIDLTTYTLRYNRLAWLEIDQLGQHWSQARVQGERSGNEILLTTLNVTGLSLNFEIGKPYGLGEGVKVLLDGEEFVTTVNSGEGRFLMKFHRESKGGDWRLREAEDLSSLRKHSGMQGPIDDAFMDSFIFVSPDSSEGESAVDRWVASELEHATREWKRQMRGDARVLTPREVTAEVIMQNNIVLFGTPQSNTLIAKVINSLPVSWSNKELQLGDHRLDARAVAPVLIYPNPLNPKKYVVLNSSFTYREYAYLNNARQIPMLPDWALIDVSGGATTQMPGIVKAAGFFDEHWLP